MGNSLKEWEKEESLEQPDEFTTTTLEKSERFSPQLKEKLEEQSDYIRNDKKTDNHFKRCCIPDGEEGRKGRHWCI
jgi:hypothetical protein